MKEDIQDLVIIGGGVMGLFTAYAAAPFANKITILEKSRIGDKKTASFGYTRSIRNDYLDPCYASLAYEARRLWLELEQQAVEPFIVNCGCLNIAREDVTPNLSETYAEQSYHTLTGLHLRTETFTRGALRRVVNCHLQFPLRPDRPSQCKYYIPPPEKRALFTSNVLPVFAYLDVGIYGHPIYAGRTPGVKIGFYNPPGIDVMNTCIHDVASFVEECIPGLQDAEAVEVTEVDQCFYDLVADDNFILGSLPEFPAIAVGVGWRGTGYKYAPWVGQVLMQLALRQGTVYDISRFSPHRFLASTI